MPKQAKFLLFLMFNHLLITGQHQGGCISSVEIVGGMPIPLRFELRGTKGALEITGHHPGGYQCSALTVRCTPEAEEQPLQSLPGLQDAPINVGQMWVQFEADIRSGSRTVPDFDRAVRLSRLLDAIEAASDEKRTVEVKQ